jgi:hypothetical protein
MMRYIRPGYDVLPLGATIDIRRYNAESFPGGFSSPPIAGHFSLREPNTRGKQEKRIRMLFKDKVKAKLDTAIAEPIRNVGALAILGIILGMVALIVAVVRK